MYNEIYAGLQVMAQEEDWRNSSWDPVELTPPLPPAVERWPPPRSYQSHFVANSHAFYESRGDVLHTSSLRRFSQEYSREFDEVDDDDDVSFFACLR
jgi:hypothetical protein